MTTTAAEIHGTKHGLPVGAMIPQPHGGRLRNGGTNRGGSGRRPDRIKKLAGKLLEPRMALLAHFADGVAVQQTEDATGAKKFELISPTPKERIAALALLQKIHDGEKVAVSDVKHRLREQFRVLRDILPPEYAETACKALIGVWK